jgi:hypothetical protein
MHRKNLMFGFLLMVGLGSAPCGVYAQNNPFEVGTVTPTQSVAAVEKYAINGSWVNVRSGPGTGNGVLKTLPRGSTGTKIAEKNGWLQIDFGNGLTGWVRADLVSKSGGATATVPAQSMNKLAAANAKQFARWEKHLGSDLLDFGRFPWYWKLNRANKAFKNGEYADAYKLAREASGNPLEAAYLQAMCLDKMGQHDAAAKLLAQLEKPFEDIVFTKKLDELAKPYVDEPIVFKFGGFDDIKTYQKKKAAGNDLGLNSGEYYEKYVDIKTWKWRSKEAYDRFQKIGGIDCSGLVQMVQKEAFAKAGVKYPITSGRTSTSGLWSEKYTTSINPGVKPPPPPDIRPGDMILLDYGHNRYGHSMIYRGTDSQGNILVTQMGDTAEMSILPPHKYEFYKGAYRMNGMDQVRKAMTA